MYPESPASSVEQRGIDIPEKPTWACRTEDQPLCILSVLFLDLAAPAPRDVVTPVLG